MKEAYENGGLASVIPSTEVMLPMRNKIIQLINKGRLMLFLEGSVEFPTDRNSEKIVQIITDERYRYDREHLKYFDLTMDDEIKPALLEYSQFNCTPQFYANGRLVGDLEVVEELHERGELVELLEIKEDKKSKVVRMNFRDKVKAIMT